MKLIDLIEKDIQNYNLIATENSDGSVVVEGGLDILLEGSFVETIQVRILVAKDFPKSIPKVYDKGNRFPKIEGENRHFNPPDNHACLFLIDERWKHFPKDSSFDFFLKGPVNNFFLSHLYFEKNGHWAKGHLRHGVDGIYQSYQEYLPFLKTKESVKEALLIMQENLFRCTYLCPCRATDYKGLRKSLSRCKTHRNALYCLSMKIGKEQIKKTYYEILLNS